MLSLTLSLFILLGAFSAYYKSIDGVVILGSLFVLVTLGSFFNPIFPNAPLLSYWVPHQKLLWILENASAPIPNILLFSPLSYLSGKLGGDIFRTLRTPAIKGTDPIGFDA